MEGNSCSLKDLIQRIFFNNTFSWGKGSSLLILIFIRLLIWGIFIEKLGLMIQVYNDLFMNNHNTKHIKMWYNSFILKYCDYVLANYIFWVCI